MTGGRSAFIVTIFWTRLVSRKEVYFSIVLFFITLLPTLKILPYGSDFFVANRYFYLPGLGLTYLMGLFLCEIYKKNTISKLSVLTLVPMYLIFLSVQTHGEVKKWIMSESLWESDLRLQPNSRTSLNNLADVYQNTNRAKLAEELYARLISGYPKYETGLFNYALFLKSKKEYHESLKYVEIVLKSLPNHFEANSLAGELYDATSRNHEALAHYQIALKQDHQNYKLLNNIGASYLNLSDFKNAEYYLTQSLNKKRTFKMALFNLGLLYAKAHRIDNAISIYQEILNYDPHDIEAKKNILELRQIQKSSKH